LHDEKVGVVDVELDRVEKVLDLAGLGSVAIDQVLGLSANQNLPGDGNLAVLLVAHRGTILILVVENDSDDSLGNSSLTLLVHKLGQVASTNLGQIGDAKHKTNRVQNVGFARAIQTRNGIEVGVEAGK